MRFRLSLLLLLLFSALSNTTFAQRVYTSSGKPTKAQRSKPTESKGFDPDKLVFGGGLSASFGTYTNIGISPIVGYRLTEDFTAGIGLGYQYLRIRDGLRNPPPQSGFQDYKVNIFTPSVWARYAFLENFFAQAEYENNFISYNDLGVDANQNLVTVTRSLSVPAILLGGGLRQRITDRSSLLLTVLFNVYKSDFQIYPNGPIFRVGFNVGY